MVSTATRSENHGSRRFNHVSSPARAISSGDVASAAQQRVPGRSGVRGRDRFSGYWDDPRHACGRTEHRRTWDKIAEDAVVRSGAFQNEGLIYMAYVSAAVYNAVVAIEGGYQPYGQGVSAPVGASTDAAVIEATYRSLGQLLPDSGSPARSALRNRAGGHPGRPVKNGWAVGGGRPPRT